MVFPPGTMGFIKPAGAKCRLPRALLSCFAKKVGKEAIRGGVELIAPAIKATLPGTPPGTPRRGMCIRVTSQEDKDRIGYAAVTTA